MPPWGKARRPKAQRPKGPKAQRPRGPAGSAGSQCLRPHGDARPPHEQGAGALRFGSDGAAVGADGGRPTSRGLPPAARWATLPCPAGQGALPVCVFDAVCPAGKGAAEWRAGSWRVAGESGVFGAVCPSGKFTSAPGNGGTGRTPQGTEIHAISRTERALLPAKPSASSYRRKRGALQGTSHARRGKPPRYAPKTSVPRLFTTYPHLFTTHPRLFTTYPRLFTPHPRLFTTYPRLFTAHPVPFTTFPHLLRSAHVFSSHFMPFAPLRAFMAFCAICGAFPALYDFPTPAYGHSAPFAAHPAPFTTFPHLLRPLRAFYCLSVPVYCLFAPLTAIPCLFTAAFLRPFRTCL